jgi:aarF domain-containing kinase
MIEGLAESIIIDEVSNEKLISSNRNQPIKGGDNNNSNRALSALQRAVEIGTILSSQVMAPILTSLAIKQNWPNEENGGWEAFWSTTTPTATSSSSSNGAATATTLSHAQRLALSLEKLGPTYVKFGQALGSRPDVVPPSLAGALSTLQDDMEPFDNDVAKEIILAELLLREANGKESLSSSSSSSSGGQLQQQQQAMLKDVEALVSTLTEEPVAAASIGQVYKANIPGKGDVAVKVQRPGVRLLVERDAELLLTVASFLESLPALPSTTTTTEGDNTTNKQTRLINTELVSTTQEFMSRIFEELDYRKEASNIAHFGSLYSRRDGTSKDVSVIVPKVYTELCTENVLVMEWIDGVKLTDVTATTNNTGGQSSTVEENLALVKVAIDSTLSQLLVQGVLHADPHAGNLLKVRLEDDSVTLGYLDFGIVSTIPEQVRDALICSVALQVFSRDVHAVSSLFGELRLIPQHILDNDEERAALAEALEITFENSLLYPDAAAGGDDTTAIPDLKFDKLLDSLSRLVPRFQFDLPPYFINNARALSTLEGIAKSLDPSFNVLTIMYPYALSRLLRNPSKSEVVARTLQSLIRSEDGKIDRKKIRRLLRDSALISGQSKRRVVWDVLKTKEGRILARGIVSEEIGNYFGRNDNKRDAIGSSNKQRQKMKNKRWYYLEL